VTFSLKDWRWSLILPAVNAVIALAIMVPDDVSQWHRLTSSDKHYEQRDEQDRLSRREAKLRDHRFFAEGQTKEEKVFAEMSDYLPSNATLAMHIINLPAYMVIGWYGHRRPYTYPLFWPVLGLAADAMPLRTRIVALDSVFVLAVAFQWWVMGIVLDRPRLRRAFKPTWWLVFLIILLAYPAWIGLAGFVLGTSALWCWSRSKEMFIKSRSA